MTLNYLIKAAVVDLTTGKAWVEKATVTLDHPFSSYNELVNAFFSQWNDYPEKYDGRYTMGILSSELL